MLGTLRLLLALGVAASHAGMIWRGVNQGVVAVVGFYLISGYVMSSLLHRQYAGGPQRCRAFYLDRATRLAPQYFAYAGLALAWHLSTGRTTNFLQHPPGLGDLLNNLAVVPLNYYMWNGADHYTLIPPAWSLGAEIQFYLLAPLLLLAPWRLFLAAGALSLLVYLAALGGWLHGDWFGYRLLPGVLWFFLLGAWLERLGRIRPAPGRWRLVVGVLALAGLLAVLLDRTGRLAAAYNRETLLGLALTLPLLALLAPRPRRVLDEWAGDISYGVFLNHFLLLWLFYPQGLPPGGAWLYLPGSILLAAVTQRLVERPVLRWRRQWRASRLQ